MFALSSKADSVSTKRRLGEELARLETTFTRIDPMPIEIGAGGLERLSSFVHAAGGKNRWPSSIPEVEELLRAIALDGVSRGSIDQLLAVKGHDRISLVDANTLAMLRIPGIFILPASRVRLAFKLKKAFELSPIATWLMLPSQLRSSDLMACWIQSPYGNVLRELQRIATLEVGSSFHGALGKCVQTAAAGAGSQEIGYQLGRLLIPDIPEPILRSFSAFIGNLFTTYFHKK